MSFSGLKPNLTPTSISKLISLKNNLIFHEFDLNLTYFTNYLTVNDLILPNFTYWFP